jgi:hypothetical protein
MGQRKRNDMFGKGVVVSYSRSARQIQQSAPILKDLKAGFTRASDLGCAPATTRAVGYLTNR